MFGWRRAGVERLPKTKIPSIFGMRPLPQIGRTRRLASVNTLPSIKEAVVVYNALPTSLFESVGTLLGFELEHKSTYYAYLVANPDTVRAFYQLHTIN
jgi:hypothetical protein